jgi:hypothetical protein
MKKLKKGPELKMPDLKVPAPIGDLYYDLRERRLLPLVALAIVAIVAVPFLLGGGARKPPPRPPASRSLGAAEASSSTLTVVQAQPGLRSYRKRLQARTATDPFLQRYTAPDLTGTKLGGGEESSAGGGGGSESTTETTTTTTKNSAGTTTETTTETGGKTGGAPSTGGKGGDGGKTPPLTVFLFAADIQYSHTEEKADGSTEMSAPTKREKVRPYSPLPGEKVPVVTYLGVGAGAKTALLMISKDVTAVFGDGKCVSGTDTCELLEVETGLPETFEYGPNHARYKINVLKIVPVPTGKL